MSLQTFSTPFWIKLYNLSILLFWSTFHLCVKDGHLYWFSHTKDLSIKSWNPSTSFYELITAIPGLGIFQTSHRISLHLSTTYLTHIFIIITSKVHINLKKNDTYFYTGSSDMWTHFVVSVSGLHACHCVQTTEEVRGHPQFSPFTLFRTCSFVVCPALGALGLQTCTTVSSCMWVCESELRSSHCPPSTWPTVPCLQPSLCIFKSYWYRELYRFNVVIL